MSWKKYEPKPHDDYICVYITQTSYKGTGYLSHRHTETHCTNINKQVHQLPWACEAWNAVLNFISIDKVMSKA